MRIVGLTGGIATGKSTVTNLIRRSGVSVIDCDEIAHLVTKKVCLNGLELYLLCLSRVVKGDMMIVLLLHRVCGATEEQSRLLDLVFFAAMVSKGPSMNKLSKHYSFDIVHGLTIGHTADVTGEIDRERLGELVFNDATARRRLNRATHPAVTVEIAKQLLSHLSQCHWLVVGSLLQMSSMLSESVL